MKPRTVDIVDDDFGADTPWSTGKQSVSPPSLNSLSISRDLAPNTIHKKIKILRAEALNALNLDFRAFSSWELCFEIRQEISLVPNKM